MPRISAAVSGSKTTGTSPVGTCRAPSRRSVRSAAVRPTCSGGSRSREAAAGRVPVVPLHLPAAPRPAARRRARPTRCGSRRGSPSCWRGRSSPRPGPTRRPASSRSRASREPPPPPAARARSARRWGAPPAEGSKSPSSTSSGGTISSGSPAAASSPVTRAIPTVSSTSRRSVGHEKSDVWVVAVRRPTKTRTPSALLPASVSVSTSPLRTVTENSVPSATSTSAASAPAARAVFSSSVARSRWSIAAQAQASTRFGATNRS